jgi:HD-GYP domain-containing protein (c-di-GMP phosphodiesterase class II)
VDYLRVSSLIVRQHHERWDGKGYPFGIAGDEIVIGARVFQVVDAYDAMTTDRPYRQGMTHERACGELVLASGTQFDPAIVSAFLSVPHVEWRLISSAVDDLAARSS